MLQKFWGNLFVILVQFQIQGPYKEGNLFEITNEQRDKEQGEEEQQEEEIARNVDGFWGTDRQQD
jgi:hypothetical protein